MKLAVTGSNGSVGRRVVIAALEAGHSVLGVDIGQTAYDSEVVSHASFSFRSADLRNYEEVLEVLRGSEAVVHLAAVPTPEDYVLGITRIAQASSVNVVTLVWSQKPKLYYVPLDEEHPCEPDEPYGLSKLICEMQADTIIRRYPKTRIASLRLSWSIPDAGFARKLNMDTERAKNDLWGWVQQDAGARAFLNAVDLADERWSGHEAFFITSPEPIWGEARELWETYWKDVPIKAGQDLDKGFFNCEKAQRLLGWTHK
ncbi:hypothetical protein EIP86_007640 [Pleurotus ostreatoroseus]|nr:hypothetical protein EIP86_007640 [Pleurotus ostreatoroseus]